MSKLSDKGLREDKDDEGIDTPLVEDILEDLQGNLVSLHHRLDHIDRGVGEIYLQIEHIVEKQDEAKLLFQVTIGLLLAAAIGGILCSTL